MKLEMQIKSIVKNECGGSLENPVNTISASYRYNRDLEQPICNVSLIYSLDKGINYE